MEQSDVGRSVVEQSAAGAVLSCRDLRYAYLGRYPALAGVDLDVAAGERLALLGPNGCGKSTLLKVLAGLVAPDAGTVLAFGNRVTLDLLEEQPFNAWFRSRLGFVFQNSDAQVFSQTVREEIAFGCLQLGMGLDEATGRVEQTMAMLEIMDLAERAPFQLSGGQKKRVAIASVLVMNPDILLFDEPTAALDPRGQQWLIDLFGRLGAAGKTIVLATHDLDPLDAMVDRCVVFGEDHTVLAAGTPGQVLADRRMLLRANLIRDPAAG